MSIKQSVRELPVVRSVFRKFDDIWRELANQNQTIWTTKAKLDTIEQTNSQMLAVVYQTRGELGQLQRELQNAHALISMQRETINRMRAHASLPARVVFVVEEPSVIKNVLSLMETMNNDPRFQIILFVMKYKQHMSEEYVYKQPGIESYLDTSQYNVVMSFDEEKQEWVDLKALLPDYVFFSRPYDISRPEEFHLSTVSQYTKICYIPYGVQVIGGHVERVAMTSELTNIYLFFMDNSLRRPVISEVMQHADFVQKNRLAYLGYTGFDNLRKHTEIQDIDEACFTVLWLPRWNTYENNCHFFEYKDVLISFADTHPTSRIILRPHFGFFPQFLATGELTPEGVENLRKQYAAPHQIDESSSYIQAFRDSSVLVADETSMIAEYYLTDKPIIFCKKETHFSDLMEHLIQGCYIVENEAALIDRLEHLQQGNDPLRETREQLKNQLLLDYGASAADNIKEYLWQDFSNHGEL